jgi:hypothetical protein
MIGFGPADRWGRATVAEHPVFHLFIMLVVRGKEQTINLRNIRLQVKQTGMKDGAAVRSQDPVTGNGMLTGIFIHMTCKIFSCGLASQNEQISSVLLGNSKNSATFTLYFAGAHGVVYTGNGIPGGFYSDGASGKCFLILLFSNDITPVQPVTDSLYHRHVSGNHHGRKWNSPGFFCRLWCQCDQEKPDTRIVRNHGVPGGDHRW